MKPTKPPRWATQLLNWWGHPDTREEVEGDLRELHAHWVQTLGERKARWRYAWSALKLLRPLAKSKRMTEYPSPFFPNPTMLRNYLKIAFRNLAKNKGYSLINIGGLAVGMAVAIGIGLWVYDELSFNTYHQHHDRLAQVMQKQTVNGQVYTQMATPYPLGKELQTTYGSNFKYVVMSSWQVEQILTFGEKKISKPGNFMDVDAARMLSLVMVKGTHDGLRDPHSILLAESTARALFGAANPLNRLIKLGNSSVRVTGVYEDLPFNTQFRELTFIAPWSLNVANNPWVRNARDKAQWDSNSFQIFAQIADHADFASVNQRILKAKFNRVDEEDKKYNAEIFLHPMRDWRLHSHWENGVRTGGLIEYVWLFGLVGTFVLLLACINFMNLSTARSEKRAKEVGIRKSVGSLRRQLVGQFLCESLLVVGFALVVALLLVQVSLPWFNEVADKRMVMPWFSPGFWLACLGFILLTGLIAGSYPALYLSSFQPVKVLKGTFRTGRFAAIPRKVLVVVQFTVSIVLISGTVIVYRQVQFSKSRPVGYDRNGLVMVAMKTEDFYNKAEPLRAELQRSGAILNLAESSSPLTAVWSNNSGFSWPGKAPNLDADFATIWVTHDFGSTVGWEFAAGRDFSRSFPTDSVAVVVNEAAVRFMGDKNPVGTLLRWGDEKTGRHYPVIGVIKDMLMQSPYAPVKQTVYFLAKSGNVSWITFRLNPARSASQSLGQVEAAFKKFIPSAPFDYEFADVEFATKFAAEERVGNLATVFAGLAIFISCLGLFGLASFVAEQRTKEIGVRKVLGASVVNLWGLLSKDFVLLVLLSIGIATPLAWYYLSHWLERYEYRTPISAWVFVASGLGALLITLLTVSFQSIKAALVNPVKSLRSE